MQHCAGAELAPIFDLEIALGEAVGDSAMVDNIYHEGRFHAVCILSA